ncbi:MAG TPA: helix-turn-helix domain-containing protein [Actinomycetota bacterium]|nr:helix-turn-helix domain-containing protein [Actinomycetota bacterium]
MHDRLPGHLAGPGTPTEMPSAEPALRTAEVAKALGVSARAVRTWADEGKIACYRTFGGHRLFAVSEVGRVLASWSRAGAAPPDARTAPAEGAGGARG